MLFSLPVLSENADQPIVDVVAEKATSKPTTENPKDDTANKDTMRPALSSIQTPASDPAAKQSNSPTKNDIPVKTGGVINLDLIEQMRMADSAEKTVDIAGWQLLLSFVGIILIFRTLRETQKATRAAQVAAEAAQDVTRQNRAWIAITDKSDNWITATDDGGYEITQGIKNTGGTPGINVRSCVNFHYFPTTEPLSEFKVGDWNTIGILPPNGSYLGHVSIPAGSDILKDPTRRCVLHTVIEYETIYSTQGVRVTEIVEEIIFAKQEGWAFDYGVLNNAARMAAGESPVKTRLTKFHIYPVGSQQRAT
jgi:hypothetical protein